MPLMKVDFWRVVPPITAPELEQILRASIDWPTDDPRRSFDYMGRLYRLHRVEEVGGRLNGEFTRIALDEGGFRGSRRGDWEEIPLRDDEGLGRSIAFIYSPANRVLVLQKNRNVASSAVIVRFFASKFDRMGRLDFLPIATHDARARYSRLRKASRLEVKFSRGADTTPDEDDDKSATDLLGIRERFGAQNLVFMLTSSHQWRKHELKLGSAFRSFIETLLSKNPDKLLVTGRTEDDELDIIDFVASRVKYEVSLQPDDKREVSYGLRIAAMREGLDEHQASLRLE